jgi:hypothetical protein
MPLPIDRPVNEQAVYARTTSIGATPGAGATVAFLNGRRMVSIPLAKTGDSDRRQILSEYTLVARNEKSSGGVFDLTTS